MFLHEQHAQGDCWTAVNQVEDELLKIKGAMAQRNTLKDQITLCVKGLEWKEYRALWSYKGKQHLIDYLKENSSALLQIAQEETKLQNL